MKNNLFDVHKYIWPLTTTIECNLNYTFIMYSSQSLKTCYVRLFLLLQIILEKTNENFKSCYLLIEAIQNRASIFKISFSQTLSSNFSCIQKFYCQKGNKKAFLLHLQAIKLTVRYSGSTAQTIRNIIKEKLKLGDFSTPHNHRNTRSIFEKLTTEQKDAIRLAVIIHFYIYQNIWRFLWYYPFISH